MKTLLRNYLITVGALWATSQILPALVITGGTQGLLLGSLAFMAANIILVPILKIMLLPLNLLTFGFFAWLSNVLALYLLVTVVPSIKIVPYYFPGSEFGGVVLPVFNMSSFLAAILASFIIGFIIHFIHWLIK